MNPTLVVWLQLTGLMAAEVAVIVGITAQMQRLIKSAAWRRTLWHACVLGLLLLVAFEFTGVARGIFAWGGKKTEVTKLVPLTLAPTSVSDVIERTAQPAQSPGEFPLTPEVNETRNSQPMGPSVVVAGKDRTRRVSTIAADGESFSILWIALIWFAGAVFVLGRAFISRLILEILRWKHGVVEDVELRESAAVLATQLGIRRRVRLMESPRICSPAAFGILRPTIGLPLEFHSKHNAAQREAMLVHELAHLAGNDPAWYLLADFLTAALWWHPLTWWARRQLHAQSELVADEASLLVANGPGVLAECLVELGARLARTPSAMPMGVAGNGFRSGLGRRVERLVKLEGSAWRPPNRMRSGLAVAIGPVALVTAAILCTAWVVPPALNKGENMQTMKQTWKKSLAALALLTALGPDRDRAVAQSATGQATITATEVAAADAEPRPVAPAREWVAIEAADQASAPFARVSAGPAAAAPKAFGGNYARAEVITQSHEQQAVEEKLLRITLSSVKYDGLPLPEVINNLIEIAAKQDRNGVNFVLNREPVPATGAAAIDPATGLPVAAPAEDNDLGSVTIKINPALKNVRLIDVLDAITKTSDRPIHYTIEDYGVLFSPGLKPKAEARRVLFQDRLASVVKKEPGAKPESRALEVMTFKVDTNTFLENMERTFGEKARNNTTAEVRTTLINLFQGSFGIHFAEQDKRLFYNGANGVIMVRGTPEDMATVRGAIEMLGGVPYLGTSGNLGQRLQPFENGSRGNAATYGGTGSSGGGGGVGSAKP